MNTSENKVELTGFAGSDAELKELGNNKKLVKLSLAVNDSFKNVSGAEVKNTHWFNLVFWNAKAEEAVKIIKKGTRISIEGRLSAQSYEAKDGSKKYNVDVVVQEIQVLNSGTSASTEGL